MATDKLAAGIVNARMAAIVEELRRAIEDVSHDSTKLAVESCCMCTRRAVASYTDECLDRDDVYDPEFVAAMSDVIEVLQEAAKTNPENRDYIEEHIAIAIRARSVIDGISGSAGLAIASGETKPHVFISYVRENYDEVKRLRKDLVARGVTVWIDQERLKPGERWKTRIRQAITRGEYFIAMFSKEYCDRNVTYMNEELTIAIEHLRKVSRSREWFIPVCLSQCDLSVWELGAGETLADIQYVDLSANWRSGIDAIVNAVTR